MSEIRLNTIVADINGSTVSRTHASTTILTQTTVFIDSRPVLQTSAQYAMILIFIADIVLDDCITADSLFSCGSDARLIILRASVHNYVGAIRETVDADSTQADIVALNFRSTAFGDLDTRTYNVGDLKSEYKLASTFTLNEYTAHRTVLNLTILDNDFIVRLRTREDSPSTKVYK